LVVIIFKKFAVLAAKIYQPRNYYICIQWFQVELTPFIKKQEKITS